MDKKTENTLPLSVHRYVYCKYGDVVDELKKLGANPSSIREGGPEHYITNFLSWVGEHPVLLLSFSTRKADFHQRNAQAHALKSPSEYRLSVFAMLSEAASFFKALALISRFRPTRILCASSGVFLWAAYIVARLSSARLVCTRHTNLKPATPNILKKIRCAIDMAILRRIPKIICHGPYLEKELVEIGILPSHILQFNLSYKYLLEKQEQKESDIKIRKHDQEYVVLYIGRVTKLKGIFDLFNAMDPMFKENTNLRLVYAGDGPDLPELRSKTRGTTYASRITVLGYVEHEAIRSVLHQADVVVTPSKSTLAESRCKVAIEAIVLNKPVIAPNFGPFPFVVEHGVNGLLYEADSISDLRAKISLIASDPTFQKSLINGTREHAKDLLESSRTFSQALREAFGETSATNN